MSIRLQGLVYSVSMVVGIALLIIGLSEIRQQTVGASCRVTFTCGGEVIGSGCQFDADCVACQRPDGFCCLWEDILCTDGGNDVSARCYIAPCNNP